MITKAIAFMAACFLVTTESAFVDNLPKCSISDNECMRNLYETIVRDIGKTGVPELGIPPVDPIHLKNVSVSVLDLLNITLIEGVAKGVKDCIFETFSINIDEQQGHQENACNITIKGHYRVSASSPLIKNFLGENSVRGDGNGKVSIEKLRMKFDFPFYAQKRDDGEIYIKCTFDKIKYDYEIQGRTSFFADNLYVADREVSGPIIALLNQNERLVMTLAGRPFIDKAMEFYFNFAGKFFDVVPARYYLSDDLTPYAKP